MSMITASAWVPRGAAAPFPTRYDIDENEIARVSELAKLQLEDAKNGFEKAKNRDQEAMDTDVSDTEGLNGVKLRRSNGQADDDLKQYDLEHYDSDPVDDKGEQLAMFGNVQSLAYYNSNAEDPYVILKDADEAEEEREELQVLATDNMIVAAKVEDEVAHLEIYVYEDEADNLYVHHDVMLPAIPLCVEWLDLPVRKSTNDSNPRGNFIAVGTFDPDIEVWDLDTVDSMFPDAILGQWGQGNKTKDSHEKKKRKKSKKANEKYHVDAVLSLAANRQHRNLLASTSADKTVKLWDLTTTACAQSYSYHTDKVCSSAWNAKETTVLLTGGYDRTVIAADMRAPNAKVPRWGVESDIETVMWNPHDPNFFFATTESGVVHYNDVRMSPPSPEASKAVWKLQAHDSAVSSFDVNPVIPGFIVTGSNDKEVKLWNIQESGPSMVVSRNIGVGKVFTTKFAPDPEVAFRLAVGGSKGNLQIWDTSTNAAVRTIFTNRVASVPGEIKERLIGIEEESSDSEHEDIEPGEKEEQDQAGWESVADD